MSAVEKIWIGADPGGLRNFGVAILRGDGSVHTFCVDCADHAIAGICERVETAPAGVGVDAPLWWSSGNSGGRIADEWLRKKYCLKGGNVQAANSLRGAALIQGAMFVHRIRAKFPGVPVTETHPKAVLMARKMDADAFCQRFSVTRQSADGPDHERDAIVSAVAAREGFEGHWPNDLSLKRYESEMDPATYWLAPVHYYWFE
jgi:predicted nuclease with RNAse H fold